MAQGETEASSQKTIPRKQANGVKGREKKPHETSRSTFVCKGNKGKKFAWRTLGGKVEGSC